MARRGHQRMARPRNQYSWERFQIQTGPLVASAAAQGGISLGFLVPERGGETVRRIRGSVLATAIIGVGFPQVRIVAYVAPEGNVAGFLNPLNVVPGEQNSDLFFMFVVPTLEAISAGGTGVWTVDVDVKAQRKLEEGSVLQFAAQSSFTLLDLQVDLSVLGAPIAS